MFHTAKCSLIHPYYILLWFSLIFHIKGYYLFLDLESYGLQEYSYEPLMHDGIPSYEKFRLSLGSGIPELEMQK